MEKRCTDCLNVIKENEEFKELGGGEYLCQHCYEENYFECECGSIQRIEDGYWVAGEEKYICDDCYCNYYTTCRDCGDIVRFEDTYYVEDLDDNICDNCRCYGDFCYCNGCDSLYTINSLTYHSRSDSYYCDNCYGDFCSSEEELLDYHGLKNFEFFKLPNQEIPREYIGAEIEVEPKGCSDIEGVLRAININNINAVGEEDSSLDCGGVEIVTHPETYEYKLEHKENYRNLFRDLQYINYGNCGHSGLHFHVSRPNEDIISRIIVILESFKEEIKKLSRRNGRFSWSKFLTDYYSEEPIKYQSSKYLKEEYIKREHDRYLALNLNNSNTIEFRFFNGASNFEEFWGALQFIHNLMDIAYSNKELNEIQWKDLLQGEELIAQAIKQDVFEVEKTAKDTTEIYEKLKVVKEETKETIKKTLRNFIKYINKQMENITLEKTTNIGEIANKTRTFVNSLQKELNFLEDVVYTYNSLENMSMSSLKFQINLLKSTAERNGKNYSRYFKQMETATLKYESEVIA